MYIITDCVVVVVELREGFQLFSTAEFLLSANFGNALRACGQTPTEAELTALLKDAESSGNMFIAYFAV